MQGCTSSADLSEQQVAHLNLNTEPPSLDPRQAIDTTSGIVLNMLFEGLTRFDANGTPEPALAERIEISEDGRTYTFHLRESQWWNGDPVTAADFVETWKDTLSPNFPSSYAYVLYPIRGAQAAKEGRLPVDAIHAKVLDNRTLQVELDDPTPYFLELLSTFSFYPLPRSIVEDNRGWANDAGDSFVGNGPFKLVEWQHGDEIVVERNPLYWEADHVKLDRIILSMVEDPATELNMFENGELDWAGDPLSIGLPTDALPHLRETGQLKAELTAGVYYYNFNTKMPPLNNAKIRKGLSLAINRKAIVENISQGGQIPALGFVPTTMPFDQKPFYSDHNVELAQKLFQDGLDELGIILDELPVFQLSFNMGETHLKIAQAIQQQWRETLGIKTELSGSEWKVYLNSLSQHDFMIGRLSWIADYNDPMTFLEIFLDGGASNAAQWVNPTYIGLIKQASRTLDPQARQNLLLEAEGLLLDEMPIAPIYFTSNVYLQSDRLQGVVLTPLGRIDFRWSHIKKGAAL